MKSHSVIKAGKFIILGMLLGVLATFIPLHSGDRDFVDRGLFHITERYRLTFEEFSFQRESLQKIYKFKGLPRTPMTLELLFSLDWQKENRSGMGNFILVADSLEQAGVNVGVTLLKDDIKVLSLKPEPINDWVLSSWRFWNQDFVDVEFSPRSEYEIIFAIEAEKELSEPIDMQLQLRSPYGGIF